MISALILVAPMQLHSQERQDVDMATTVGAALSKTQAAKTVEIRANEFIEKYSKIPKEQLGIVAAIGKMAVSGEISTFQLKNTEFGAGPFMGRFDIRYKPVDRDSTAALSFIKEF